MCIDFPGEAEAKLIQNTFKLTHTSEEMPKRKAQATTVTRTSNIYIYLFSISQRLQIVKEIQKNYLKSYCLHNI